MTAARACRVLACALVCALLAPADGLAAPQLNARRVVAYCAPRLRAIIASGVETPVRTRRLAKTARVRTASSPEVQPHIKPIQGVDAGISTSTITILSLCCAIAALCALDRVLISIAIIPMSMEMGFSDSTKGLIASSFSLGYAVGLIPAGLLSVVASPKTVLGVGLIVWSAAQAVTPFAAADSLSMLLAARVFMGVGEAAALPCIQNIAANFVTSRYRSQFWGLLTASLSLGTISAYTFSPKLIEGFGWESTFYVYGGIGFILAALWLVTGKSAPQPTIQDDGATSIADESTSPWKELDKIDWKPFYTSRPVWALAAGHAAANFYNYFALAWLPTYFSYQFGLSTAAASSASLLPFVTAAIGGLSAGFLCDTLVNSTGITLTRARKLMQTVGSGGPAATLCALAVLGSGVTGAQLDQDQAELLFMIGVGTQAFSAAGWGCGIQDISTRYASLVYGSTTVFAVAAGASGQYFTGWLLEQTGRDFTLMFAITAAVELAGLCAFWAWWDSERAFE